MADQRSGQTQRYREGAGLDHTLFPYSPIDRRPPLAWPDGARLAFMPVLYLEYLELDPPEGSVRDPRYGGALGSYFPDYLNYSHREYGSRVGIFRILEVLDRHGITATVAINAAACARYPHLVEECQRRGYEFAAHGTHATRMISSRMSEAEERAYITESIEAVTAATGTRPIGWIGQDFNESTRTPALLAEAGLRYVMDWPNDDQPYAMNVGAPFVSIPNQADWDDTQLLAIRRVRTPRYPDLIDDAFDQLHSEGAQSGRLFGMGVHPWLLGQAHRIRYLDEALQRISGYDNVWQTTAGPIADWFLRQDR